MKTRTLHGNYTTMHLLFPFAGKTHWAWHLHHNSKDVPIQDHPASSRCMQTHPGHIQRNWCSAVCNLRGSGWWKTWRKKKVPTAGASKVQLLVTDLVTCASAWMVSIEKTPNTIAFLSGAALRRSNIYFNSSGIERKRHQEIWGGTLANKQNAINQRNRLITVNLERFKASSIILVKSSVGSIRDVARQVTSRARQAPTLSKDGLAKAIWLCSRLGLLFRLFFF